MINISTTRGKYIIRPNWIGILGDDYYYNVYIGGNLIFTGRIQPNTIGTVEIDCSDWIDSYISKQTTTVTSLTVTIDLLNSGDNVVDTVTYTYTPYLLSQSAPGTTAPYMNLNLLNCGFLYSNNAAVSIPLMLSGDKLVGKTINKLEKTNYVDKYGDTHNGSIINHYEIECFIDPCWLHTTTNDDDDYERVMLALQGAKKTTMVGNSVKISGMDVTTNISIEGRIKDIEKVETSSSYSVRNKIPTYKITFEVYR